MHDMIDLMTGKMKKPWCR